MVGGRTAQVRVLPDTSALIRLVRGNATAEARFRERSEAGDIFGCCDVTLAEFYSGVAHGSRPRWDTMMSSFEFWPTSREIAMRAGRYRFEAMRRNVRLSVADTLIAAVARAYGATILTANPRDFPMDDVAIEELP